MTLDEGDGGYNSGSLQAFRCFSMSFDDNIPPFLRLGSCSQGGGVFTLKRCTYLGCAVAYYLLFLGFAFSIQR